MSTLIRNGLVLTDSGMVMADVLIADGRIQTIGPDLDPTGHDAVEAAGCWVGPGFVDLHVHLREPGQEWKEDIASGSKAAAAGGYTHIVAMPNTDPALDSGHLARYVVDRAVEVGLVDVIPAGCVTLGRNGEKLAHLDELWSAGVRLYTDDGDTVADAGLLRRAMDYLAEIGGIVAQHAEDPGLARDGHMHEGTVSSRLGMRGLPALAEEVIVARDLRLVELTGCRYHVQHVSTAGSVELVRQAKAAGLPVTAEVTPHHLVFDHRLVEGMSPEAKMYPPLRAAEDVAALKQALIDGTIDCVATDHAPHSAHEKDVPFEEAPRGVIGLETAAAAVHSEVGLEPADFFDRMAIRPAGLLGIDHGPLAEGAAANVVVFDPEKAWSVGTFNSKSSNSPWVGKMLTGKPILTVYGGEVTHREAR